MSNSILKQYIDGVWTPVVVGARGPAGEPGEAGATYDQDLNTTDSATFAGLRVNGDSRLNSIIADDDTHKIVLSADYTGEGSGSGGIINIGSDSSDIGNKITITAAVVQIQNLTYPSSDGTAGQLLTTDGSGNLSWAAAPSSGVTTGKAIAMAMIFG
jgi:hypothetical protein